MNPYPPTTISHAIAACVLARAAQGRWATTRDVQVAVPAAHPRTVFAVRQHLRNAGLLFPKGAYSRWTPGRRDAVRAREEARRAALIDDGGW